MVPGNIFDRIASSDDRRLALALFLFALLLRLVYLAQIQSLPSTPHLSLDAAAYDRMAVTIANGDWLGNRAFYQAPLYPYFLAVLYKCFGHNLNLVRLVQLILGAVNCVIVVWTARKLFGRNAAAWSGVLVALYGILVFYDGAIGKDGISVFLTDLTLFALICSLGRPASHLWLLSGAALGASILTRGNLVLLVPLIALWMVKVLKPCSVSTAVISILAFVAGTALFILPVTVRNYVVSGDFVLTTSQAGQNFYIGNNPRANGFFENPEHIRLIPEYEEADFRAEALRRTHRKSMKPSEISKFWLREGLRFIRQNPQKALRLLLKKAAMFWNRFEIPDNYNYYFIRERVPILRILLLHFGIIAPLGLFGLYLGRKTPAAWLFIIVIFGYMASIVPFHMASRYRLPIVPALIVFGGYALDRAVETLRLHNFKPTIPALLAVGTLALFVNWKVIDERATFKAPYTDLGIIAEERGDYATAIDYFKKALEIDSAYAPALYNLGNVLANQGKFEDAVVAYKKALRADPELLLAYNNLGKSYIRLGRFREALQAFEIALAQRADFTEALIGKGLVYHMAGRYPEAIQAYHKAIEIEPASAEAYYNLACAYARSGRIEDARAALARAIQFKPDYKQKAFTDNDLQVLRGSK
ncbi:MAG: hypothetical protein DRH10_03560 [Deltaproteobacteria bacterium]|nr:MAG: hypothetical protein DRH10_03560 [Deltaproteobacteria bacterium]RLB95383.1 MAG: hypothetical protein DRH50_04335 [Deltaproteobacteria bacterium]